MTPESQLYKLENLGHSYGSKPVLDIHDLTIHKGSIIGLIGPNGSGKTTLLKLLAFALRPTQGRIFYNGQVHYPFSHGIRSKITLLTQKPYLLKRSVYDNIIYGLKIRKDNSDLDIRVKTALSHVGLDFDYFAGRMWHELSGGEAQRVAMAARLILKPETLLLDEPVANVDAKSARLIRKAAIRARDRWGTTLVIASHDLSWLFSVTDQQLSLIDGKLFTTGLENMIPGPFKPVSPSLVSKQLIDNQTIRLTCPDQPDRSAMIRKDKISLFSKPRPAAESVNQLIGRMISMNLEQKPNLVMVRLVIGELEFELSLSPDQIKNNQLFPGQRVYLSFHANDVKWI
jgi:tungstate transport system ATP-binding protein